MVTLTIILFAIFFILSMLHFSWALGSSWGFEDAIPKNEEGEPMLKPKKIDSMIVGIGLLFFGVFYLIKSELIEFDLPALVMSIAKWIIPSIFLLRAIGDFRYVGFSKKVKSTAFAKKDTKFYAPLCLAIAGIGFALGII